jgi:alkanesulfonate monooxygenase SsuD/methylene tetrahydromethanopterin reductase-like flavin-dependent oxidoreductase (luciferase family)
MGAVPSLGLVLPLIERPDGGGPVGFAEIVEMARSAEQLGFDTVWLADELVYRFDSGPLGWWECLTMAGAVAARTTSVHVGTWVVAARRRDPGLVAKAADTLDEISAGRFVLGLGAGSRAGTVEFGFPEDRPIARYEDFLDVLLPLLRDGTATVEGRFHRVDGAELRPRGPRAGRIPLMLGAHGQRTMRTAVEHADIWSGYATESSQPEAFTALLALVDRTCEEQDRDPASLERSLGLDVEPGGGGLAASLGWGDPVCGSTDRIVDTLARFGELGVTRVEVVPWPWTSATLDALAPVLESLRSA